MPAERRVVQPIQAPARAADARVQASSEPAEVHVTIGRIEVTAAHDAPAVKPRRRARTTTTLAEYLARRQDARV